MSMNINKFIKSKREERGLSVKELADIANFSFKTIYLWESGEKNITYKSLVQLLDSLGLEIQIVEKKPVGR